MTVTEFLDYLQHREATRDLGVTLHEIIDLVDSMRQPPVPPAVRVPA
jgi:hypothetical protein